MSIFEIIGRVATVIAGGAAAFYLPLIAAMFFWSRGGLASIAVGYRVAQISFGLYVLFWLIAPHYWSF